MRTSEDSKSQLVHKKRPDHEHTGAVEVFRATLTEKGYIKPQHDDFLLQRFLQARGFDLEKATAMFINNQKWREEFGADTILEDFEYPEKDQVKKFYPHGHHKTDKRGHPIYIEHVGRLDVKSLMEVTDMDRLLRYHVQEWERLLKVKFPACSRAAGRRIEQSFTILDLKEMSGMLKLFKTSKDFLRTIMQVDADNYPEHLFRLFIINAPFTFKGVWSIIRPWLDERTATKIQVFTHNGTETLLQYVDANNLPAELGGNCQCPGGCINSDEGPWRDPAYLQASSRGATEESLEAEGEESTTGTAAVRSLASNGPSLTDRSASFSRVEHLELQVSAIKMALETQHAVLPSKRSSLAGLVIPPPKDEQGEGSEGDGSPFRTPQSERDFFDSRASFNEHGVPTAIVTVPTTLINAVDGLRQRVDLEEAATKAALLEINARLHEMGTQIQALQRITQELQEEADAARLRRKAKGSCCCIS
eukprot:jgi/Mesvir1/17825/Mv12919-RA.1